MPWRFVGFILGSVLFLVFIGFNLGNRCDISFGFTSLSQVPVYLAVFASFILGMLCTIPIIISFRFRKSKGREKRASPKKGKKQEKKGELGESLEESPYANDGSYGID